MSVLRRPLAASIAAALGLAAFAGHAAQLDPQLESRLAGAAPTSTF